jgi:hypothetical protein
VSDIVAAYGTDTWCRILKAEDNTESFVGLKRMILFSLCGHPVTLSDKLNGVTVNDAKQTGILILESIRSSDTVPRFTIVVPLVLIRALNRKLHILPEELLDPFKQIDDRCFEHAMCVMVMLRNNLLVSLQKKQATYKELFPGAIGHPEDLGRQVPLTQLEILHVYGKHSAHESMHRHPLSAIPILHAANRTLDVTKV